LALYQQPTALSKGYPQVTVHVWGKREWSRERHAWKGLRPRACQVAKRERNPICAAVPACSGMLRYASAEPLTPTQEHILSLLALPLDLYARLAAPRPQPLFHLRE
jgi:hypothetical protein